MLTLFVVSLYVVQREKDNVQLSNLIIINHAKGNQSRFPTDIRLGFITNQPVFVALHRYLFCKIWSMKLIMGLNFCCTTNSRTLKVRLIVVLLKVRLIFSNFFFAFLEDLGNFKHFEPYLFF